MDNHSDTRSSRSTRYKFGGDESYNYIKYINVLELVRIYDLLSRDSIGHAITLTDAEELVIISDIDYDDPRHEGRWRQKQHDGQHEDICCNGRLGAYAHVGEYGEAYWV